MNFHIPYYTRIPEVSPHLTMVCDPFCVLFHIVWLRIFTAMFIGILAYSFLLVVSLSFEEVDPLLYKGIIDREDFTIARLLILFSLVVLFSLYYPLYFIAFLYICFYFFLLFFCVIFTCNFSSCYRACYNVVIIVCFKL